MAETMDQTGNAGVIRDPALYDKLSEPFASVDEAAQAIGAFLTAVRALREEYRITDVATVVMVNVQRGGPDAESVITGSYNGAAANEPHLLAWALGKCEAEFAAKIERVRRQSAAFAAVPPSPSEATR